MQVCILVFFHFCVKLLSFPTQTNENGKICVEFLLLNWNVNDSFNNFAFQYSNNKYTKKRYTLQKQNQESAKPKQKSAAKKMKEMSQSMASAMMAGDMQQMEEDAKALRQILDNLLAFSYDEEALILPTKSSQSRSLALNKILSYENTINYI